MLNTIDRLAPRVFSTSLSGTPTRSARCCPFCHPSNGCASDALRALLSSLPLQLKLRQNGKLGAKRHGKRLNTPGRAVLFMDASVVLLKQNILCFVLYGEIQISPYKKIPA
jgi:hypothetical protein